MAALHARIAAGTAADGDVELAIDRPAWNLRLILLSDVRSDDASAAARATLGQGRLVNFVDDRRNRAAKMSAVIVSRLASGLFRIGFGQSLGERSRLPL